MFRTIAAVSKTSNQEQIVGEEETPIEDCATSCRSCELEVSREGLSSDALFFLLDPLSGKWGARTEATSDGRAVFLLPIAAEVGDAGGGISKERTKQQRR